MLAFQTKDEYVYAFFKFMPDIDNLPSARKLYKRLDCLIKFYIGLAALSIVWMLGYLTDPINTMFAVAIILDLIETDYNFIKFKVLEEKVCCNNERQRDELQQLQNLLEDNPLRFNILADIRLA
ncbi:uncharacterized protein LOC111364540 [Spodoptera litura]|uniref:Uncharacterized protein LOC111364540 n=1 Tax=Spodoptera litura TaxID=69820 RepID=A0A9J7EW31_SPOLT|nr:uncharacterized protein LOC111364540 [Spodoptera litura]